MAFLGRQQKKREATQRKFLLLGGNRIYNNLSAFIYKKKYKVHNTHTHNYWTRDKHECSACAWQPAISEGKDDQKISIQSTIIEHAFY